MAVLQAEATAPQRVYSGHLVFVSWFPLFGSRLLVLACFLSL